MIFIVQKSSFLGDLRSFLLLFFVWTENKGAFTVTKKLQRLYTCCSVSNKLSQVSLWFSKANQLIFLPSHLSASIVFCLFVQQVEFCATVLFLGDFTPDCIVLNSLSWNWQLRMTTTSHRHKPPARGKTVYKLFINWYLSLCLFSSVRKSSFSPQTSDRQLLCPARRNIPKRQKQGSSTNSISPPLKPIANSFKVS